MGKKKMGSEKKKRIQLWQSTKDAFAPGRRKQHLRHWAKWICFCEKAILSISVSLHWEQDSGISTSSPLPRKDNVCKNILVEIIKCLIPLKPANLIFCCPTGWHFGWVPRVVTRINFHHRQTWILFKTAFQYLRTAMIYYHQTLACGFHKLLLQMTMNRGWCCSTVIRVPALHANNPRQ